MKNPFEQMDAAANVMPTDVEQIKVQDALAKLRAKMQDGEKGLMSEGTM